MLQSSKSMKPSYNRLHKNTSMWRIVCKSSRLALRPQIREKIHPDDEVKVMGSIINPASIKQLWIIRQARDSKLEIINFSTDLFLQAHPDGIKLERKQNKMEQRFQIMSTENQGECRIKGANGLCLCLDGIVEPAKESQEDENQIFDLEEQADPYNKAQIANSILILQSKQQRCLSISPQKSDTPAQKVSLEQKTDQISQMWIVDPKFNPSDPSQTKYSIINLLTHKHLWVDPKGHLIQADERVKIWQLHKRHLHSGQIYCIVNDKYLNYDSSIKDVVLSWNSNGTKWQFIN